VPDSIGVIQKVGSKTDRPPLVGTSLRRCPLPPTEVRWREGGEGEREGGREKGECRKGEGWETGGKGGRSVGSGEGREERRGNVCNLSEGKVSVMKKMVVGRS